MKAGWAIALILVVCAGAPGLGQMTQVGDVTSVVALPDGVEVRAGAAAMKVEALRDDVLRVRVTPDGTWQEDASWAVLPAARTARVAVTAEAAGFRTGSLRVVVERAPMRLRVEDLEGYVLSEDAVGFPVEFRGARDAQGGAFKMWKALPVDEHIFGLGDKGGPLDRRGETFVDWNMDAFLFQESTDPLYKSVPFFVGETGGRYYGLFVDNTWRMAFDFGRTEARAMSVSSDGGALDYYVLAGPDPKHVVESYAWLTGLPPLPPRWSLGYQQSRFTYAPESVLRGVATRLREDRLPADVLWLDIDFQDKLRTFTVDRAAFPDMKKLLSDLRAEHFHVVAITDLQTAVVPDGSYEPYRSAKAIDGFVKTAQGEDFVGRSWPGQSAFPDFAQASVRQWWSAHYKDFVELGFAGFWNDMNEPSVFSEATHTIPVDAVHRIVNDGFASRAATHAEMHNVYGQLNARATFEGLREFAPEERPFVMARALYAGGQRYAVTWTGDNSSTWAGLKLSGTMLLNLGLSGYGFAGADVGGFVGSPTPDLLEKWLEIGAFEPIDRDHSDKRGRRQEPWVDGPEREAVARKYLDTRYRLLPYLYTVAEENARTGLPMMRPLFLEFPDANKVASLPDVPVGLPPDIGGSEWMLGPALLVAPGPFGEKPDRYRPELPGAGWYDFWSGERVRQTRDDPGDDLAWPWITPRVSELPVYVRAGAIVPMQSLVEATDETPTGPLEVHVFPGSDCAGSVYLDDGHSLAYQRGEFLRERFTCVETPGEVSVELGAREGTFAPWWTEVEVVVHGWSSAGFSVTAEGGGKVLRSRFDAAGHAVRVVVAASAGETRVRVVRR